MIDLARQQLAHDADPLVVKVGTRCLTLPDGTLDECQVESIAEQLVRIGAGTTRRVVLVSSGAVGAGIGLLKLPERPTDLPSLQAAAAVGQCHLMESYNRAFQEHGLLAAQVLLTADDINDRRRYLNFRNAIRALFEYGAIPIVNENDTVRTAELSRTVGDNDQLAAMVTNALRAPLLVILTDVDGLYDGDPADESSQVIGMVEAIDESTTGFAVVGTHKSGPVLSKGGMLSKLQAASIATHAGESVILANGRSPNILVDLMAGEPLGTLIPGQGGRLAERKRWIGSAAMPIGALTLDAGAVEAVAERGKSLLPIGIKAITGIFDKGDLVSLIDEAGVEIARGLTNYDSSDLGKIMGQPSEAIADILGRAPYSVAVHRNDLALVRDAEGS
ncbi:glutamate 5-kinase [Botrimarina mediterranea]|uniref:Glutamate 5-kinase n=1 Tax=Botrimarina mediterranea TaxID=2528022 RepID=A0A518KCZ5_9BACT|nr:glutamate 5-kinase [Botrimarina mediterranea]QDV75666.1 Glutamate 5-kinase [Botrimarina mediterranea]QDV80302.1 Glutamate 5-kinase [Planctomycetes bacterium K2D]